MKRKRWNDFKKLFDGNLWIKAAACGFVLTVLLRFTGFSAQCDELSRNMLRLHVLANSDTQADQETKLLVRDAVLTETAKWYADAENFDEALACVCAHVESIEAAANRVLAEQGKEYRAALEIGNAYFPTRIYGETVVPAGKYRIVKDIIDLREPGDYTKYYLATEFEIK